MRLKGLPNRPKVSASSTVDLPLPLSPMIRVEGELFKAISMGVLPVERKFFHITELNFIILLHRPL
jgi:hypothetical protein